MRTWLRSLEGGLAVRLGLLYLVATAVALGVLFYQAYDTAGTLDDRDLNLRATDLARYVVTDPGHGPRPELPSTLAAAYAPGSADFYAVRSKAGRLVAATPRGFGEVAATWPTPKRRGQLFSPESFRARNAGLLRRERQCAQRGWAAFGIRCAPRRRKPLGARAPARVHRRCCVAHSTLH